MRFITDIFVIEGSENCQDFEKKDEEGLEYDDIYYDDVIPLFTYDWYGLRPDHFENGQVI